MAYEHICPMSHAALRYGAAQHGRTAEPMPSIPSDPAATPPTRQIEPGATISRRMSIRTPELPGSLLSRFKRFLAASLAGDPGTG